MAETESTEDGYFSIGEQPRCQSPCSVQSSVSLDMLPSSSVTIASLTALQYLPMPVLILSSRKTVVLANEAMGKLLSIDPESSELHHASVSEFLYEKDMDELGIDILQNGSPILVSWKEFLDSLTADAIAHNANREAEIDATSNYNTGIAPRAPRQSKPAKDEKLPQLSTTNLVRTLVHDASVEVVIAPLCHGPRRCAQKADKKVAYKNALQASCIISIWTMDESQYFTLTFTSTATSAHAQPARHSSRIVYRTSTSPHPNRSPRSESSSSTSQRSGYSSSLTSKVVTPAPSHAEFPPRGPPLKGKNDMSTSASMFQKATQLKDAILNSISMPAYAMWKDESFGIPNKALLRLLPQGETQRPANQRDFLSQFSLWTEDFQRQLSVDEFPIMEICRTRERLQRRVGMRHPSTNSRMVFEVNGEAVSHEETGEFLGALVILQDITEYTKQITAQIEENEKQFEYIANFMPVMVWTTTPDGMHDWFSQRWYDYTGLTVEESLGEGWRLPFHPDDMTVTGSRWRHSLETGEEYNTEYRCRRHNGEWRWMLGRALAVRDDSGRIVKWYGTCTDIHDLIIARQQARRTREQLQQVMEHAKILLWAANRDNQLTLLQGDFQAEGDVQKEALLGKDIYEVFNMSGAEQKRWQKPIQEILNGKQHEEIVERYMSEARYYRTRLMPLMRASRTAGVEGHAYVDGVIGVSMDITELRERREQVRKQEMENTRLLANAAAAKEASRMKSQFLANMSHEIRTPIAGVIGMSELLFDMDLNDEQKECAENIHRSANSLLTVINDILDFSKVESGRLDVEEVQFSLSVVLQDVNKMMSFAAQRKGLSYQSLVQAEIGDDLRVIGDPGRLRQILTNMLTNSIKFTPSGSVKLSVTVTQETKETVTIRFTISDTGIGIEEEVRKRLFQPFSQADCSTARRFGGTGLGLTISKNLVKLMKGEIWLESQLGQGTTATFWIPFSKAPSSHGESALVSLESIPDRLQSDMSVSCGSSESHTPPPTTQQQQLSDRYGQPQAMPSLHAADQVVNVPTGQRAKFHILVVEDNHINQQIALKTIKKLHFSVSAVWNGQEALEYLRGDFHADHPRPDIILMDVQMPIRDGYSTTQAIRRQSPWKDRAEIRSVPIVAMTASAIFGDKEKCKVAGMDDYLAKPVKGKVLEKMLVKWAVEGERRKAGRGPCAMGADHVRAGYAGLSQLMEEGEWQSRVGGLAASTRTEDDGYGGGYLQAAKRDTDWLAAGAEANQATSQTARRSMPLTKENIDKLMRGQEDGESSG